ncbi:MAG: 4-phosphoerythronate dehydrogenase [Ignavibacteria bacterium]|jgi:erythronate-4-phosphate dehydrogenase
MLIVADENITFAEEAFSRFGEVKLLKGREISNSILRDADALFVRSVTKVNEDLLTGTKVKFVGTATIGTDHIDIDYLEKNGIEFTSAKGCNSFAVTEYVLSAVNYLINKRHKNYSDISIGIIGVGNIGSKLERLFKTLGSKVLLNDPPLKRETNDGKYISLEEVLSADIITCHVPLNLTGEDKTFHLLDEKEVARIKPGAVVINSSRGPVINNKVLKQRLIDKKDLHVVLDVWENEPNLDPELLDLVEVATPHVAGYSLEGKINGTKIIYDKFCEFLKIEKNWLPEYPLVTDNIIKSEYKSKEELIISLYPFIYDIKEDSNFTKKKIQSNKNEIAAEFDKLRKNYNLRRELSNYWIRYSTKFENLLNVLRLNYKDETISKA